METNNEYTKAQNLSRIALGAMLITAGIGHLTFARKEFQAQVPDWVPVDKDTTVLLSGFAEIALGAAIAGLKKGAKKNGTCGRLIFYCGLSG